jgi:hypothetical protein
VNAGKVVAIVKTDADAFDVAIGLGFVWATTSRALLRIDPATNAVVGASPGVGGAAIGSGVIWATDGSHVLRLAPGVATGSPSRRSRPRRA